MVAFSRPISLNFKHLIKSITDCQNTRIVCNSYLGPRNCLGLLKQNVNIRLLIWIGVLLQYKEQISFLGTPHFVNHQALTGYELINDEVASKVTIELDDLPPPKLSLVMLPMTMRC